MVAAKPSDYDVVVVDAEPLVGYFRNETEVDTVERFLVAVEDGTLDGRIHDVTRMEVFYVCARATDRETAADYVESLVANGFVVETGGNLWRTAGVLKTDHTIAIGDAFALATARKHSKNDDDVLLLVGGDDDFDPFVGTDRVDEPDVVRFRAGHD